MPASLTGGRTPFGELSSRQRAALEPLAKSWDDIAPDHQQKWIEIATRFPKLPEQEQSRIQTRMTEWAQMSPQERGRARLRFQEAKRLPPLDKQARWEEFQALSPEQRHTLYERAAASGARASTPRGAVPAGSSIVEPGSPAGTSEAAGRPAAERRARAASAAHEAARTVREEAIAPAIVQAKPGATTTLMSKRAATQPTARVPTPKIAAASHTIDATTLLPRKPAPATAAASGPTAVPSAPPSPPDASAASSARPSMEMPHPEFYK